MTEMTVLEELKQIEEQENELKVRKARLRGSIIKQVQDNITKFDIQPSDLVFNTHEEAPKRTRKPSAPKYVFPNGDTWTGKGRLKKTVAEYLAAQGETEADLPKYLAK